MRQTYMYFFRTFTFTGILNVLPQLFLINHVTSSRSWLLPLFLILYSVSGVAGLWWSRTVNRNRPPLLPRLGQVMVVTIALVMNLTLLALFEVRTWPNFLVCLVILAFTLEASFNWMDHASTRRLSHTDLGRHSSRASLAQLLGVCLAPLTFTFGYSAHRIWILVLLCAMSTGLSYWSLSMNLDSGSALVTSIDRPREKPSDGITDGIGKGRFRLYGVDLAYFMFVLSVYCAAFLFSSYGIFMLRNFYRISQASTDGAWMIATMNVSSIVGAVGYGAWIRRRNGGTMLLGGSSVGVLLVAIVLFALRLNFHLYFILMLACMAGIPYGCFLVMSRDYASKRTLLTGNHVLSLYNMTADAASITAFLVSLVVTLSLGTYLGTGYLTALIFIIIAFLVLATMASFGIPLLNNERLTPN